MSVGLACTGEHGVAFFSSTVRSVTHGSYVRWFWCAQLKNYIDDTEDYINLQLDNHRNQLLQLEIILTIATFVMAMFSVVVSHPAPNTALPGCLSYWHRKSSEHQRQLYWLQTYHFWCL
jgi:hypothetical protein